MSGAYRTMRCDQCALHLYEVDEDGVKALSNGNPPTKPLVITVNNRRMIFCGKSCATTWIDATPIGALVHCGYPLW